MDTRDSQRLVEHASAGDREALDRLFARCLPRLRRLLQLQAGVALHNSELDDLVQEAYLEATRRFGDYTYQGPDSFFRWLATVALHRLSNLRRTATAAKRDRRRERRLPEGDASSVVPQAAQPVAVGPGPRTLVMGAEAEGRLDAALSALSASDREVITLARLQGLPLGDVAERMGRTRNAVALLLSRALRKLRDAMGDGGDGR